MTQLVVSLFKILPKRCIHSTGENTCQLRRHGLLSREWHLWWKLQKCKHMRCVMPTVKQSGEAREANRSSDRLMPLTYIPYEHNVSRIHRALHKFALYYTTARNYCGVKIRTITSLYLPISTIKQVSQSKSICKTRWLPEQAKIHQSCIRNRHTWIPYNTATWPEKFEWH